MSPALEETFARMKHSLLGQEKYERRMRAASVLWIFAVFSITDAMANIKHRDMYVLANMLYNLFEQEELEDIDPEFNNLSAIMQCFLLWLEEDAGVEEGLTLCLQSEELYQDAIDYIKDYITKEFNNDLFMMQENYAQEIAQEVEDNIMETFAIEQMEDDLNKDVPYILYPEQVARDIYEDPIPQHGDTRDGYVFDATLDMWIYPK